MAQVPREPYKILTSFTAVTQREQVIWGAEFEYVLKSDVATRLRSTMGTQKMSFACLSRIIPIVLSMCWLLYSGPKRLLAVEYRACWAEFIQGGSFGWRSLREPYSFTVVTQREQVIWGGEFEYVLKSNVATRVRSTMGT